MHMKIHGESAPWIFIYIYMAHNPFLNINFKLPASLCILWLLKHKNRAA